MLREHPGILSLQCCQANAAQLSSAQITVMPLNVSHTHHSPYHEAAAASQDFDSGSSSCSDPPTISRLGLDFDAVRRRSLTLLIVYRHMVVYHRSNGIAHRARVAREMIVRDTHSHSLDLDVYHLWAVCRLYTDVHLEDDRLWVVYRLEVSLLLSMVGCMCPSHLLLRVDPEDQQNGVRSGQREVGSSLVASAVVVRARSGRYWVAVRGFCLHGWVDHCHSGVPDHSAAGQDHPIPRPLGDLDRQCRLQALAADVPSDHVICDDRARDCPRK